MALSERQSASREEGYWVLAQSKEDTVVGTGQGWVLGEVGYWARSDTGILYSKAKESENLGFR